MTPLSPPGSEQDDGELRSVTTLLEPGSFAVVGVSTRHPAILDNVFEGHLAAWAVNPSRTTIRNLVCFPSLDALPTVPDVAVIAVNHKQLIAAVEAAGTAGVRGLVVPGAGAEAGAAAGSLRRDLARLAALYDLELLGPNCMGYVRPGQQSPWLGCLPAVVRSGSASVVTQSGSVADGLLSCGQRIGFRLVISSGAEAARDSADYLAYLADDEGTVAIGMFLEQIRRPLAFAEALRRCAEAEKPIVCLKVGRSTVAKGIAVTHTGAVTGAAETYAAFFRAYGVIEVRDLPDLVETLDVLASPRRVGGRRVAAVCESGGEAELLADKAVEEGLELTPLPPGLAAQLTAEFPNCQAPANPLDAWAIDDVSRIFPRSLELLASSGSFDILVAAIDLSQFRGTDESTWCKLVVEALAEVAGRHAVFAAVVSCVVNDPPEVIALAAAEAGLPLLRGPGAAVRALARAASWRPRVPVEADRSGVVPLGDLLRPGALPEHDSASILERYGIRFAERRRAATADDAAARAIEIGFPVVVKVDGPAHKADAGGVALGIVDAAGARAAAARLGGRVLVARQVPPGLELLCGFKRDPDFGVIIALGAGGALAETAGGLHTALGPIGADEAFELVDSIRPLRQLRSRQQIAEVLIALSQLALHHPVIEAVDVNPLVVTSGEVIAVDALVVVQEH